MPGRLCAVAANSPSSGRSPFGRTILISGPEVLLAERAVAQLKAQVRAEAPDVEVSETEAIRLDAGRLVEMTGASLFSTARAAVITDLANLPAELMPDVAALATDRQPELALIVVHGGSNKGKGLLDKLKAAKVEVIECKAVKSWELPQFVMAEAKRAGGSMDSPTAQTLIDAVGHDLRALAGAVAQLLSDNEGRTVTAEDVRRYFGGRSEVTSFAVSDAVLSGQTGQAMEQLRWALSCGVAPVLVTSALASGLRGLGKLQSAGSGMAEPDLAKQVGVPPWKLKSMRQQLRGWDAGGLARAIKAVAAADADVKGAAGDPAFALERAVLGVAAARRG